MLDPGAASWNPNVCVRPSIRPLGFSPGGLNFARDFKELIAA